MASARYCSAKNCKNKSVKNAGEKGLRFYRFPKDQQRCAKWVQNCGREDFKTKSIEYLNKNCLLCSAHFEQSQQFPYSNRLVWNAIPTLFHGLTPKFPVKKRSAGVNDDPPPKKLQQDPNNPLSRTDLRRRLVLADHRYCEYLPDIQKNPTNGSAKEPQKESSKQPRKGGIENPNTKDITAGSSIAVDHGYSASASKEVRWVWKQISSVPILKEGVPILTAGVPILKAGVPILKAGVPMLKERVTKITRPGLQNIKETHLNINDNTDDNYQRELISKLRSNNKEHRRQKATFRVRLYRLKKKVEKLERQREASIKCTASVEHTIELAGKYMEGPALDFFAHQMKMCKRKRNGRRYKEKDMEWAMNLYKQSPIAYKILSKTFTLPHVSSIQKKQRAAKKAVAEGNMSPENREASSYVAEENVSPENSSELGYNEEIAIYSEAATAASIIENSVNSNSPGLETGLEISANTLILPQVSEATSDSDLPQLVDRLIGELGPMIVVQIPQSSSENC